MLHLTWRVLAAGNGRFVVGESGPHVVTVNVMGTSNVSTRTLQNV